MADQKKWFKVWASILTDPDFLSLSLTDKGRWFLLGSLICQHGEMGKLTLKTISLTYLNWFEVSNIENLKEALQRLPNVVIEGSKNGHFEANDSFTVTMKNWRKYQVDSSIAERVTRLRRKRREEEIRGEDGNFVTTSKPLAGPYGG